METKKAISSGPLKPKRNDQNADFDPESVMRDYYICCQSREISKYLRRDVLTGRAKFGIADDGKEVYQVAMAHAIEPGDWRADYYRGHTLLLALDMATAEDILAQLYADTYNDKFSAGRQMNNHHATPTRDEAGNWLPLKDSRLNISSANSPTAAQMPRGLGLAYAGKVYRDLADELGDNPHSRMGKEVCWTEIGDASTSEGVFWESINAAGVTQVPMITIVADDGYGISVPTEYQTTKGSISEALAGMQAEKDTNGLDILAVKGWNYEDLRLTMKQVASRVRRTHRPALIHIQELTQPSGHSTSGSHERYKDATRMQFEKEWDALRQFRLWIEATDLADKAELDRIEKQAKTDVREARARAWADFLSPLNELRDQLIALLQATQHEAAPALVDELSKLDIPNRAELLSAAREFVLRYPEAGDSGLRQWIDHVYEALNDQMSRHLLCESELSPMLVPAVAPSYAAEAPQKNAYEILQRFFDAKLAERPDLLAFGEDVGHIGDVNQGFAGLQAKYGEGRVFDTGIREWTILGQGLGMAMRGLRPIAEIQYLDYIFYALPLLADDLATLRWRSNNQQSAPLIVRTRGHRLEGIWHSGSQMATLIHCMRGVHLCVPRNAVQAAGMYNTLLDGDDPALVIEVLNGYRRKERLPENLADVRVPLGVPDVLQAGSDLTLVTYGGCVRVCQEAMEICTARGLAIELIDVQTLLPFDVEHRILRSIQKTNRLLIVDEDTPGGASAYLMRELLETQGGYHYLDAPAKTLTATAHRPAYGDDGDYAAKPQVADVVEACLELARF